MRDVDARVNERVLWMAPPYRSPAQQNVVQGWRERSDNDGFDQMHLQDVANQLRAAGADEATVRSAIRSERRRQTRFRQAVADGTAACAYGGTFWCIWGFKP